MSQQDQEQQQQPQSAQSEDKLTIDQVRALIAESLAGFEKRLGNIVNSAVVSHLSRASKHQSAQEQQDNKAANKPKQSADITKLEEQIKYLHEQIEKANAERREIEAKAARERARRALADALAAKGITGARQRAVIADLELSGAFRLDEDGTPMFAVTRSRVKGARPTEIVHRDIAEAVDDWLQTDDAKEFLPVVSAQPAKQGPARLPVGAGQRRVIDPASIDTPEKAEALALELLGVTKN
jgi:hypothetical protein